MINHSPLMLVHAIQARSEVVHSSAEALVGAK